MAEQDRWWTTVRVGTAIFSVAAHAAVVGGTLWLATPPAAPSPSSRVVQVALIQQPAMVAEIPSELQPAPQPAPPEPPPLSKPVERPAPPKPEPRPEPVAPVEQVEPAPPAEPIEPVAVASAPQLDSAPVEEALIEPSFQADYLHNPRPNYPLISRRMREQGEVSLRVLVSSQGEPVEIALYQSSGYERLDRAAQDVVAHWQFVPARRGSRAVEAWVIVPIVFSLGG